MGLKATAKASGGNGNYEVPEAGNQEAILVAIIDLGTHENEYQGKAYDSRKVQLVWELTTQEKSEKENHVIGREYTLSISEKSNLGKLITALTGKKFADGDEFDITKLLGMACFVNIVHGTSQKGNTYARVEGASSIPKDKSGKPRIAVPPAKHKPVVWDMDAADSLPEHLDWLPFIIGEPALEVIRRSKEWKEKSANGRASADEGTVDELADEPQEDIPY